MLPLPLSLRAAVHPGTSGALGWMTIARGVIDSQLSLNLYEICCCDCVYISLWDLMILKYLADVIARCLLVINCLRNLERPQSAAS